MFSTHAVTVSCRQDGHHLYGRFDPRDPDNRTTLQASQQLPVALQA